MSQYDTYTSPLASRNASQQMLRIWSPRHKFQTWRRIWLAVAEAQHEMGLPVSREQVEELRANLEVTDADMQAAEGYERKLRHDVMAHVHAWGDRCPRAKGIIHLGMTSEDVGSNADMLTIAEAASLVMNKLTRVTVVLGDQAERNKSAPTLGFTHYQPAQPITVGRRMAQWGSEIHITKMRILSTLQNDVFFKGIRGATGTQASFVELAGGDAEAADRIEAKALETLGPARDGLHGGFPFKDVIWRGTGIFDDQAGRAFDLTTQTYPRVIDTFVLADLASVAAVLHKIATDIRLLSNRKELDEPFEEKQIGSSAMPYKRNPMRCERICGLSRFVMNLVGNAYETAATQWLERTLDDSSNRRLSLPEAFLALDGALDLMHNVASGLVVHEAMVRKNLMAELPFMATENLLMACVKAGGDRQEYHELIRQHAQAAGLRVKQEGLDNDLLDRLHADAAFHKPKLAQELDWDGLMDPMKYIGRSVEQTERFLREVVEPLREDGEGFVDMGAIGPLV